MAQETSIQDLAHHWLQIDRDDRTRKEIERLLLSNDEPELERRLRKRLAFGTAGLRAPMKAGFSYMNAVTVLQASQGLAQYVIEQLTQLPPTRKRLSIVVGYDARHNSETFAKLAAAAFLVQGLGVLWFGQLVHTPMVPFAVGHFEAAAGVMVTASHNPKNDNGYKVYWSNGCQIIPPHDKGIAGCIDAVRNIASWDTKRVDVDPSIRNISTPSIQAYFEAIQSLVSPWSAVNVAMPSFTYTPMHGVGLPFMEQMVRLPGLQSQSMLVVSAQANPDPEFPTVPFPNPEEKGALDLAMREAEANGSSIIVANDPDADRFAVAERLETGEWKQISGNQMGVLLASHIFETYQGDKSKLVMLASTVSSRMLAAIAREEGFQFKETLTGFKWLGNIARELQRKGFNPAFAFEEAIGYCFPSIVWDKDGIAAAAVFLCAWQRWHSEGLTPLRKLQRLYQRYGYFEDANTYLISPSADVTTRLFGDIRTSNEGGRPIKIGQHKILRWRDLTMGYDSAGTDGKPDLPTDPSAQMITCELESVVLTARGSGTEPKIKLYIEAQASTLLDAKNLANEVLQDLLREWFRPPYGLKLAGT